MGTVLLAEPRAFCAGVERAVGTVRLALEMSGQPVYVRRQADSAPSMQPAPWCPKSIEMPSDSRPSVTTFC